jgi:hypothetical protein
MAAALVPEGGCRLFPIGGTPVTFPCRAYRAISGPVNQAHSSYLMPFWPLPPLLALASLSYVFTQQTRPLLEATLITMGIGFVYWAMAEGHR